MIEFKGSSEGIRMIIDEEAAGSGPETLYREMRERLAAIGSFLSGAHLTVEIALEELTSDVILTVTRVLREHSDMTLQGIRCRPGDAGVVPGSKPRASSGGEKRPPSGAPNGPVDWIDIHHGTVRGGQRIDSSRSLVVLGSVNPGGSVSALGNIYVFGTLKGVAHAGVNGRDTAWIYADSMSPLQLRIADQVARDSPEDTGDSPECAVMEDGGICVYPASHLVDLARVMEGEDRPRLEVAESGGVD